MAARKHLLALHRQGQIILRPPRCQPPKPRPPPDPSPNDPPTWPSFTGTLAELGPITLQPVTAGTEASHI
jgi:hypothetical protein